MKTTALKLKLTATLILSASGVCQAAPVVRLGSGANPAAIQAIVDQFRSDLGGANNGVGGSFVSGRREINWDGVPDSFSEPNNLPVNFFNSTSPRGIIFNAIEDATGAALNHFAVSANAASGVPLRFGNLNATYSANFITFSAQRLFIARNTHLIETTFFIPGTKIPATVKGFGVIFTDVDSATGGARTLIRVYGPDGIQLSAASAPVANGGLSFVGISFNAGEQISRVVIEAGNAALSAANNDGAVDVVAMDDFIYGEPQPLSVVSGTLAVSVAVPLKFTGITAAGAPAGFMRISLQCSPGHTYRFYSSTDVLNWKPALVSGAVVGPDQNLFNPRANGVYLPETAIATADLSKEGLPKLFYRVIDETTGDVTMIGTP